MTELSAILCHHVFPIKGSSAYALPGVHILDLNHHRGTLPLIYSSDTPPEPAEFVHKRFVMTGFLIAHSYFHSTTYLDRGESVKVYNVDPLDVSKRPISRYLVDENEMFALTPDAIVLPDEMRPVTDYSIEDIIQIGNVTKTFCAHFKKKELSQ